MKIGIKFLGRDEDFYHLGSRRLESLDKYKQFITADVPLDPSIEKALNLTRKFWEDRSDVPLAIMDSGNHGHDRGLVFIASQWYGMSEHPKLADFTRGEIITRISIGGNPTKIRDRETGDIDYTNPKRVHINVSGARKFFPKNWRNLPLSEEIKYKKNPRFFTPVIEQVHVSLRWLDNKFDDWNNMETWAKEYCPGGLGNHRFDSKRTTYCVSYIDMIPKKSSLSVAEDEDKVRELIKKEGRKHQTFPVSPLIKTQFSEPYSDGNKALELVFGYGMHVAMPVIGYSKVGEVANIRLNDMCGDRVKTMTPERGVDFLFQEVLPAIEKFVLR